MSYPMANRQRERADELNGARELAIVAAEKAGKDLVSAKEELLQARKVAKAESLAAGNKTAAGQASYADDHTIKEESAVNLANVTLWAAKKVLEKVVDRGEDRRSQYATLRKEMDIANQGGQP